MANRECERVRRVGRARQLTQVEEPRHHLLYLFLAGTAVAGDRELHLVGAVFTTGMRSRPAIMSASPLAWPTDIAVRVFTWNSTRSTAIATGRISATNESSSAASVASRSGSGRRRGPDHAAGGGHESGPVAPHRAVTQHETPGSIPSTTPLGSNTGSMLRGGGPPGVDAAAPCGDERSELLARSERPRDQVPCVAASDEGRGSDQCR